MAIPMAVALYFGDFVAKYFFQQPDEICKVRKFPGLMQCPSFVSFECMDVDIAHPSSTSDSRIEDVQDVKC
jgi:hypothetical protein